MKLSKPWIILSCAFISASVVFGTDKTLDNRGDPAQQNADGIGVIADTVSITIDHVEGANPNDSSQIYVDSQITFVMRLTRSDLCGTLEAYETWFRIYSPDGATWTPLTYDLLPINSSFFDILATTELTNNGSGADTVAGAATVFIGASGIPEGFNENYFKITTQLNTNQVGKTLCIDSVGLSLGVFSFVDCFLNGSRLSGGPYCFQIIPASCCDLPGDADGGGDVNIGDATFIVKYVFQGGATPVCCDEADADAGGDVNIGDATHIVKFVFQGGAAPTCPSPGGLVCL